MRCFSHFFLPTIIWMWLQLHFQRDSTALSSRIAKMTFMCLHEKSPLLMDNALQESRARLREKTCDGKTNFMLIRFCPQCFFLSLVIWCHFVGILFVFCDSHQKTLEPTQVAERGAWARFIFLKIRSCGGFFASSCNPIGFHPFYYI